MTKNYKGQCFTAAHDDAFQSAESEDKNNIFIVHGWLFGYIRPYLPPRWLRHAWCEVGERVVDLTIQQEAIPKKEYYKCNAIKEEWLIRYPLIDFARIFLEQSHYGPFDDKLFPPELDDFISMNPTDPPHFL